MQHRGVHHRDVLVEVPEQGMDGVARRAVLVEMDDQLVARVLLDQFARREVMLKIDGHFCPPMFLPVNSHIRYVHRWTTNRPSTSSRPSEPRAGAHRNDGGEVREKQTW